ncbi:MAG: rod shape-determining protein MreD [Bacteroidales bacterium]|nr:rod shape-determining protein MreD [Bacteroidales bacterium]
MKLERFYEFLWRSLFILFFQIFVLNYYTWHQSYTSFAYIMILLILPLPLPWYAGLLVGFFLGLMEDIFTTKQGLHAAALTFISFIRPSVLQLFSRMEVFAEGSLVDSKLLGWRKWLGYVLLMTLIYSTVLYFLQYFSFRFQFTILKDIIFCTIITMFFIISFEMIFLIIKKKAK